LARGIEPSASSTALRPTRLAEKKKLRLDAINELFAQRGIKRGPALFVFLNLLLPAVCNLNQGKIDGTSVFPSSQYEDFPSLD